MSRGLGLLCIGEEGIGKTTFGLQFEKPLKCISIRESGFDDLEDVGEVPEECVNINVTTHSGLYKELRSLQDFATVLIDSTSGLQKIVFQHIIDTCYGGSSDKFNAYYTGPRQDGPIFMGEVCQQLDLIRAKGCNVIVLGHRRIVDIKNPMGADYSSNVLQMDDAVRETMVSWAQAVLYMAIDISITTTTKMNKEKQVTAGKASDVDNRVMYTQKSPAYQAKNRLQLPPVIPMGHSAQEAYKNFVSKLPLKIKERMV